MTTSETLIARWVQFTMSTKILPCKCEHKFQDERYGKGKRVHNKMKGGSAKDVPKHRCTVCGAVN